MINLNVENIPYFGMHNHTDRSNFRLKDCINKVDALINYAANEIKLKGLAITDHETLASHVEAINYVKDKKKSGEIPEDFKLALGNEIYLLDREVAVNSRENNLPTKFYHFLLITKNRKGYETLKRLSSLAWENSYFFRGMERVPTYKDDLQRIIFEEGKGNIIATTACIGSEFAQNILKYVRENDIQAKREIHKFVTFSKETFGEDFYIELQPSFHPDQVDYNKAAIRIAEAYNIKTTIATDSHYLNKDQAKIHEIYLKSDEGEREVADFYSTTYLMSSTEMWPFFEEYMSEDVFKNSLMNTLDILEQVETFDLYSEVIVPKRKIPEFEIQHLFKDYYAKYEYIRRYANSPYIEDRFHLYEIEKGFVKYKQEFNEVNLSRINEEYKELWLTSEKLQQPVSSYYILTQDIVNIMWRVSLVGVSRGSAASWYTVYLLGITQINPIQYNLPHWRHLTHERPEMPDIDIDSEASQRANILQLIKEEYGSENVLNISTLTREKTKSAILSVCRGMDIDNDVAQNIANLIPTDKSGMWTLRECIEGNEEQGKKPVKELVEEFEQYPGLLESIEAVEGLVSGRSVHASGIYIFKDGYLSQNAMMKTTGGQLVTQFNMQDSDYMGGLKMDALTINALDRIRANLELLLKEGKIEWQGDLRSTYEKYIHPDVLDLDTERMYELLHEGEIFDAFQFDSAVGSQAVQKIKPKTFLELSSGNSLMRLSPDHGESPLDRYVRHKKNISEWYQEMEEVGLSENEIMIVRAHLDPLYGVADTQEIMMLMSMDPQISNFGLTEANKLRKGVAKKSKKVIEEVWEMFKNGCKTTGCSDTLRDYVWNSCFKPQFGYSFSLPHIAGYTLILMQELNLAYKYGVIFWKTACLTVNAGLIGEREGNTNYGAVAKAVGDMRDTVLSPDINLSELGFTPLESEGKILFGLKPISGLGKDAVKVIFEKRPFTSLQDFVDRAVIGLPDEKDDNGEVIFKDITMSDKKGVTLIKSGALDSLCKGMSRRDIMVEYIKLITPKKEKLIMTNLPTVIDSVPKSLEKYVKVYELRNKLFGRNKVKITREIEQEFRDFCKEFPLGQIDYTFDDGSLSVDKKTFDKVYQKAIDPLKEWVVSPEAAQIFNKKKMREFWISNCSGSKEQWEMETVVFYSDKHELDYVPLNKFFNIDNFFELEPSNIIDWKNWGRKRFPRYEISIIAGTVVDKDKDKKIVYLSTQYGVVSVKYHKGSFLHYDKKVVDVKDGEKRTIDVSWFTRGTKLVVVGYRRDEEFVPKVYKDTAYENTTMKILDYSADDLRIQQKKYSQ